MFLFAHHLSGVWIVESENVAQEGEEYVLRAARRLRYWKGPSDLSGVANGCPLKPGTYSTGIVTEVRLTKSQMREIHRCSAQGAENLRSVEMRDVTSV